MDPGFAPLGGLSGLTARVWERSLSSSDGTSLGLERFVDRAGGRILDSFASSLARRP
jgi:hypothetical protein